MKDLMDLKEFFNLLDLLSEGAFITSQDNKTIYVNNAMLAMTGFSKKDDFISYYDAFHAEDECKDRKENDLIDKIKSQYGMHMSVKTTPLCNVKGKNFFVNLLKPNGTTISTSRDKRISGKANEIHPEPIEKNYQSIFNHAGAAIAILGKDYQILLVNHAFEDLSGFAKDEIIKSRKTLKDFISRKDLGKLIEHNTSNITTPSPLFKSQEVFFVDKVGKKKEIHINLRAIEGTVKSIATFLDITDLKVIQKEAEKSENIYKTIFESTKSPMAVIGEDASILLANAAMEELTGLKKSDIEGKKKYSDFLLKDNAQYLSDKKRLKQICDIGSLESYEAKIITSNAKIKDVTIDYSKIKDANLNIVSFNDITDTKKNLEQIRYLSFYDNLTDLNNRAYFEETLRKFSVLENYNIGIMIIDLNGLKIINDIFGFDCGDKMLQSVARIIKESARSKDILCRYGGDEFIIIIPEADQAILSELVKKINIKCNKTKSEKIPISLSIGYAFGSIRHGKIRHIIKEAEDNMYKRKLLENKSNVSLIVTALENVLLEKSYETKNHAKRILDLSIKLGLKAGLVRSALDELALLAKLHDIGKIAIPDTILKKKSKLNKTEWEIIKKHTEIGYRISQSIKQFAPISDAILSHHEWWDGSGYPNSIKEEKIPVISRIIAITDAYDVMVNGRPYKKKMSIEESISELKRCSGTQFDPTLVDRYIEIILEESIISKRN
jgi:diguanylate cyclase (GGDEF)-like protein/PAS domain S-box-containing protein